MATHDPSDVIRVDVLGLFDDSDVYVNSYQFQLVGATAVSDAELLQDLDAVVNAIYTVAKALMTAAMIWNAFRTTNITIDYFMGESALNTPISGTASSDSMPPGVAALMYAGLGGAHKQVRKYYGPVAESLNAASGRFGGSYGGIMEDIIGVLDGNIVGTFQQFRYGHWDADAAFFDIPASFSYSFIPAYQRRRKQGRGS